jgi:hypothetical protein
MDSQHNVEFALNFARTSDGFGLIEEWKPTSLLPFHPERDQSVFTGRDYAKIKSPLLIEYCGEKDIVLHGFSNLNCGLIKLNWRTGCIGKGARQLDLFSYGQVRRDLFVFARTISHC